MFGGDWFDWLRSALRSNMNSVLLQLLTANAAAAQNTQNAAAAAAAADDDDDDMRVW